MRFISVHWFADYKPFSVLWCGSPSARVDLLSIISVISQSLVLSF